MAPTEEDDIAKLKMSRRQLKAGITRRINKIERHVAEGDKPSTAAETEALKEAFIGFEKFHNRVQDLTEDLDQQDKEDDYFFGVQNSYINTIKKVRAQLEPEPKPATPAESASKPASYHRVESNSSMPRLKLKSYSGDPLEYHSFIAIFEQAVVKYVSDDSAKLLHLLQFTDGEALQAIQSCTMLDGPDGYTRAREILEKRFGNEHLVMNSVVSKIRQAKSARTGDELQRLADNLSNGLATLKQLGKVHEVDSQTLVLEVVNKLPNYVKNRWKKSAVDAKREKGNYPGFRDLVVFLEKEVDEATDPVYGKSTTQPQYSPEGSKARNQSSRMASSFVTKGYSRPPCAACNQDHKIIYCQRFKQMTPTDRIKLVRQQGLCENCLYSNHITPNCRSSYTCGVPGCGKKHSKFLHTSSPTTTAEVAQATRIETLSVNNANIDLPESPNNSEVYMPVCTAKVKGQNAAVLLDSASTHTFCTKEFVQSIGITGQSAKYSLSTLSKSNESVTSQMVDFDVLSNDGSEVLSLKNVIVVDSIPVNSPRVNITRYKHLKGLTFVGHGQRVQILIGQDHAEALVPLDVRRGSKGEPFAVKTILGWTLYGSASSVSRVKRRVISHFITTQGDVGRNIDVLWNLDNDGVGNTVPWSVDDRKVCNLWNKECTLVDGHYELPIPWKNDAEVPNNYSAASMRLKSTKKSLMKRGLYQPYHEEIQKLLQEGYAESIPPEKPSSESKVWYLPHQAVTTDKKPGKLRMVFDCSAKFNGQSLNDKCLQGPNLTNKLLNVLLRFRQHSYALVADIQAMYYQVLIPEKDRNALRFLWFDEEGEVVEYRMTRHVFGGVWCASSSAFALRQILEDNPGIGQDAADTIKKSFYVDDCLKSIDSRDQVLPLIGEVSEALNKGGFHLTKFIINDPDLLKQIPGDERAKEVKKIQDGINSKVLGINWDVTDDTFKFCCDSQEAEKLPTSKRKMLSILSSIYNPLGLLSPLIVQGKVILQEATMTKINWDEDVTPLLQKKWADWITSLRLITYVKIPRCIKPSQYNDATMELHHFSDASQQAYGCCSYLRSVNKDGQIHVSLLLSKSRIAPTKSMTIPRLELQAAVLAAKVDASVIKELDLGLCPSYFWTDSEIVLKYIRNESRRFHVFVANRISTIHQLTQVEQWQFVPGEENPADKLTRGEALPSFDVKTWLEGPQFLHKYKSAWNLKKDSLGHIVDINTDDPEVKKLTCMEIHVDLSSMKKLFEYHSSWYMLKRSIAWLLRFKQYISKAKNCEKGPLTVEEVKKAERVILKYVQQSYFQSELAQLSKGNCVPRSSKIFSLDPIINSDGLIRVGGRLKNGKLHGDYKHPIIIPREASVARLIALECHNIAHCGTEWVIGEIRKHYWITSARVLVKSISHNCLFCKKMFSNPCLQKMSDLPPDRLEAGLKPFTYTGVDCFGPFLIRRGRIEVKRYACIFTCLSTRAIHLEKLDSMNTDSFLNGFRRFIARRGLPKKVRSDNGTNFTGGYREIRRNYDEINRDVLKSYGVKQGIEWEFNPPHASHMGGVWERMIRTVRKVMTGLIGNDCRLTDEALETLLCEIENIVNSRPITKVSDSVQDASALTPNHLLLLADAPPLPPGLFTENDLYKRRWRQVQHLTNTFWKRWVKEYIPSLIARNKWQNPKRNLKMGDLVLITSENTPRGVWPMGLVLGVKESTDGLVRSVRVKTRSTELVRPIHKLVLLEGSCLNNNC